MHVAPAIRAWSLEVCDHGRLRYSNWITNATNLVMRTHEGCFLLTNFKRLQVYPESPALVLDSIQDLNDSSESKINLWYLDDGYLDADYGTLSKDLKKIVESEKTLGFKTKPTKCDFFAFVTSLKNDDRQF